MAEVNGGRPVPDTDATVEFLEKWEPGGPWYVVAIDPMRREPVTGGTFDDSSRPALREFVDRYQGERNLYFHVNPLIHPPESASGKASRSEIAALAYVHVDIDPREGEDVESEQRRAEALLTSNLPEQLRGKRPTAVVFSGGGYQGFWRLRDPVPIGGEEAKYEDAKRYNLAVELAFEADHCHNVDRIMRLPGTINVPDEKKRKKGRRPALARLVEFDETRVYDAADFDKAPELQTDGGPGFAGRTVKVSGSVPRLASIEELKSTSPIADWIKDLIVNGYDPGDAAGNAARNLPRTYKSPSEALYAVCCALVKAGVSDDDHFSVITDPAFGISRCVLDKPRALERYAVRQIERAKDEAIDPHLRDLNERYAVIRNIGGRCRVIEEVYDEAVRRHSIAKLSFEDFRNAYCNKQIQQGFKAVKGGQEVPNMVPLGKWWLTNESRREYDRVIFRPLGGEVPGCYNLWKGFAVEPRPGDYSIFEEHIRNNVCGGSEECFTYLWRWMARTVQRPDVPGETAVVMRGRQGTGKTVFGEQFGSLFGSHFLAVSDPKHLVGSFNAHLRDCVVLLADEAYYAGDRKHSSNLKMLVTAPVVPYELKGVDIESGPNYTHVIIASNADWVVPANRDERRFFVLDVGEGRMKQKPYFRELREQLDAGGREGLLYDLMNIDLTGFEVRDFPETEALRSQKLLSLSDTEEWWYLRLCEGRLLPGNSGWSKTVPKEYLLRNYTDYSHSVGIQRRASATRLGMFLQAACPEGYPKAVQRVIKTDEGGNVRKNCYEFPGLDACRDHFDRNFGGGSGGYTWPELNERESEDQMEIEGGDDVPF